MGRSATGDGGPRRGGATIVGPRRMPAVGPRRSSCQAPGISSWPSGREDTVFRPRPTFSPAHLLAPRDRASPGAGDRRSVANRGCRHPYRGKTNPLSRKLCCGNWFDPIICGASRMQLGGAERSQVRSILARDGPRGGSTGRGPSGRPRRGGPWGDGSRLTPPDRCRREMLWLRPPRRVFGGGPGGGSVAPGPVRTPGASPIRAHRRDDR